MHVDYPSPRLEVEPRQALILIAVVLAAVIAWLALRPAPPEAEAAWEEIPAAPTSPTVTAPQQVVVSVVGAVDTPGLVTLEQGARVADALAAASPRPEADLVSLNQAQLLVDGQQIHVLAVGEAAPAPAPAPAAAAGGLVSLNTAAAAELEALPGIGAATAAAIIAHREANGPFSSVDALLDVKGIGPAKFEALKDLVSV
ncbi:competence protein ComEA [Corynebacterium timonense]|uniref:Competence protein ComEA n=2 Tax=Corynebacterium timonense TaxID=441500 RepID=A0A1H1LZQ4_9CORY|nr:competence protein ComEA [Corynebacterium timonense]